MSNIVELPSKATQNSCIRIPDKKFNGLSDEEKSLMIQDAREKVEGAVKANGVEGMSVVSYYALDTREYVIRAVVQHPRWAEQSK